MARRQEINVGYKKEIWDHFKPSEMEVLAAYVKAYDGILPHKKIKVEKDKETGELAINKIGQVLPKFSGDTFHDSRPYTIYERFRRAYMVFAEAMKLKKSNYAIADILEDGSIDSGTQILEPKLREESKRIYGEIFGKDGISWGDPEALDGYVEGHGGQVCESYGFKKCEPPPFVNAVREMSVLEMDEAPVETIGEGLSVLPKKRGRPARVEA